MKLFGVNIAGSEFDGGNPAGTVPGVYSKDYTYPVNLAEHQYYVKKGLTLFRLPLRWERIQRTLLGDLNADDIAQIKTVLDTAEKAGAQVILDLHNYGAYQTAPNQIDHVTIATANTLADVWTKLATTFKDHPALFGYELMNEPHDLPDGADGWVKICQIVATAIEAIDDTHYVMIPGYQWQSTANWNMQVITGKNILYAGHTYFDGDASGQYWWGTPDKANGTGRLQPFISWLKANNAKGIVTEYGVPFGAGASTPLKSEWYPILEDFLTTINTSDVLIGGTAWAAGPWWGNYNLTIEPSDAPASFTTDRDSMAIYQKFPSAGVVATPTPPVSTPTVPPTTTPQVPQTPATPPVVTPQPGTPSTPAPATPPDTTPVSQPAPTTPQSPAPTSPSVPQPVINVGTLEAILTLLAGLLVGLLTAWLATWVVPQQKVIFQPIPVEVHQINIPAPTTTPTATLTPTLKNVFHTATPSARVTP